MVTSILAIAKTHIVAIALGVTAAALIALVIFAARALANVVKRENKLLASDVYAHIPRPKAPEPAKEEPKKSVKKKDVPAEQKENRPKRGKKNKKPKYVFVTDQKTAETSEARDENGGANDKEERNDGDVPNEVIADEETAHAADANCEQGDGASETRVGQEGNAKDEG